METLKLCKCGQPAHPQYDGCEDCYAEIFARRQYRGEYEDSSRLIGEIITGDQILDLPVTDLELNPRTINILNEHCINFIKDLLEFTEPELMEMCNIGEKALEEIKKGLQIFGLSLLPSDPC